MKITRRQFLGTQVALGVGALAGLPLAGATEERGSEAAPTLKRRLLGQTGEKLSVIGLGGVVLMKQEQKKADEIVARAVDHGVNYFDVAPTYGDAELKLGPALRPYRDKVFLACKSTRRDGKGVREQMEQSLRRLETDHLDLYQLHALTDVEKDIRAALAPGGAVEALVEARKKGLVRFLGFSAHSVEASLEALAVFPFDTILYPVNYVCHFRGDFDQKVIEEARKRKMGILAIKALAQTVWPKGAEREYPNCWYKPIDDETEADLALRWTLSQPVTAAVPPGDERLLWLAVRIALRHKPVTKAETAELEQRAASLEPIFRYQQKP